MTEWRKVKLGDMLLVKKGDYITKKEAKEGIYPVILGGKEPAYYIDRYNHTGKAIVISRSGASAGYVSYWNEPIFVTDGFLIEPKDNVTFEFLYYTLKSKQRLLHSSQKGAAIPHVTPALINDIDALLPSFPIQRRIAEVLSRYDTLIENYQRQIKLLEEAAQRLYKECQSTPIINNHPQSWQKKKLAEITCKFATGLNPRKNFVLGQGDNYYVTIKNMADNDVIFDDKCDKVDNEALEKINKRSDLQQGDLLFSGIGTIGRVYLIDEPVVNWNISESVFTMRPVKEISPVFLYLMLLNKDIQDYCQSNAHGCAQKGIRMADLKAYETIIPDKETLESFVTIASKFIKRSKSLRKQIRNLSEARDRLLPKLMSAEIEV